jgi:hypothetical protein
MKYIKIDGLKRKKERIGEEEIRILDDRLWSLYNLGLSCMEKTSIRVCQLYDVENPTH